MIVRPRFRSCHQRSGSGVNATLPRAVWRLQTVHVQPRPRIARGGRCLEASAPVAVPRTCDVRSGASGWRGEPRYPSTALLACRASPNTGSPGIVSLSRDGSRTKSFKASNAGVLARHVGVADGLGTASDQASSLAITSQVPPPGTVALKRTTVPGGGDGRGAPPEGNVLLS